MLVLLGPILLPQGPQNPDGFVTTVPELEEWLGAEIPDSAIPVLFYASPAASGEQIVWLKFTQLRDGTLQEFLASLDLSYEFVSPSNRDRNPFTDIGRTDLMPEWWWRRVSRFDPPKDPLGFFECCFNYGGLTADKEDSNGQIRHYTALIDEMSSDTQTIYLQIEISE